MAKPTYSPSPALLSVLAIIASSSTAIQGPEPPSFLCPCPNNKGHPPSPTISPSPPLPRRIPPKYERGEDGLWRKAESYSLYGLTVTCPSSCLYPTQMPTHLSSFSDDELQVSDSYNTPSTPPTSTTPFEDSLPLGWKPVSPQSSSRATVILALSLLLALFICFFIIGCLFWRKSIIKRRKRDLEAEFKKHNSVPSAAEEAKALAEKETKTKQKILARAAARWKANVRHAVRQRRGKRVASSISSQVHQPSHSSTHSRSQLSLSISLSPSRTISRRSSFISQPDDPPQPIIGELSQSPDTISPMTTSPHTNVPISPPAYHHDGQLSPNTPNASNAHRSRCPSQSSSFRARIDPHGISTPKHFHAAHVATDDKALLARLAHLASRPPEDASTDTSDSHVSAPAWHDELEEIPHDLITSNDYPPDITCVPSSLFPPPPSMERTAVADRYEYSFSFEDMVALEPEPGPSAPPFQLDSALPLDDHQIIPSAPPLIDDTELFVDVHPSAPQWESTLDLDEETPTGQDHDRITSVEVSGPPPSANVQPASISRQEFGTVDDITLPGYRP